MPPIPRTMLQPTALPGGGRRQVALPQTNPGTYERAEAAMLANDRGLDLTPIGDALYKAGSAFVEMEKQRKAQENELAKIKQENAARHYIIEATQKAHDLQQTLIANKIDDPQMARQAFYGGLQGVIDERKDAIRALGPFAEEAVAKHYAKLTMQLGPALTQESIKNARQGLIDNLDRQENMVIDQMKYIQDDTFAAEVMADTFEHIVNSGDTYLSKTEGMQRAQAFFEKATEARFRFLYGKDEERAIEYLSNAGLDQATQDKMITQAYTMANQEEHREDREQKLLDRQEKQGQDESYVSTRDKIIDASRKNDFEELSRLEDEIAGLPEGAYGKSNSDALLRMINDKLKAQDDNPELREKDMLFLRAARDPGVPVSQLDNFERNNPDLHPETRAKFSQIRGDRLNTEYGRIAQVKKDISRQALATAAAGELTDDAIDAISDPNERAKRLAVRAQIEQFVDQEARKVLAFDSEQGNNFQALEAQQITLARSIGEAFKPVYEGTAKAPTIQRDYETALSRAGEKNSLGRFKMGDEELVDTLRSYASSQKAKNPEWNMETDAMMLKLREQHIARQEERARPLFGGTPYKNSAQAIQGMQEQEQQAQEAASFTNQTQEAPAMIEDLVQEALRVTQQEQPAQTLEDAVTAPGGMTPQGIQHLEEFEGRRPQLYDDATGQTITHPDQAKGFPTIGIGHLLTDAERESGTINIGGREVSWQQPLSDEDINTLLNQDMSKAAEVVDKYVTVDLNPAQRDALTSFAFNVGEGNFRSAGAIKALNEGDTADFLRRHAQWNKSKGKVMAGLTRRRASEAELFNTEI